MKTRSLCRHCLQNKWTLLLGLTTSYTPVAEHSSDIKTSLDLSNCSILMSEENGRRLLGGIIVMLAKVVYICSGLLQLAPRSRDLSQSEKRITVL